MEELKALLEKYLNENLELITLSAPRKGREELKTRVRPVLLRDELKFQFETFRGPKAFHENLPPVEAVDRIAELMTDVFCQLQLQAAAGQVTALVSKKGKITVREKRGTAGKAAPEELTEKSCALLRYLVGHFNSVTNMLQNMPNAELHFSRFENINEFIQDNLSEKLTLSAVASREFLSTQYLAGEFKKRYGITFNEMLNYYRVIHSVQLLLSTELSITDICSRCGFSATRYYYKYFKKYLLITPHEFRRNNKRSHRKICDYQELSSTESWACFSRSNDSPHYAAPRPVKKVLLLNPNTNPAATARIEKVARATFSPNILVKTSSVSFGPDVLRSSLDETISELAVTETLLEHKDNYDGVIIACFSDLGKAVKPLLHVPAISVAEAAYYSACLLGEHFSVITSGGDLERKLIGTTIERCGLTSRCLSIKSLYIDFLDITPETALAPLERLVQECKEKDCADVVVLACVSLAGMGEDISRRLKIPVIDGVTQSALFMEAMLHTEWTKLIQNTVPCTPSTLTGSIYTNHIEELYSL